jgi:excisionase family DNA binding protein
MLTLGEAARLTGLGKITITRAIKAGRLSATRRDDGAYRIDPAELSRAYSIRTETPETVAPAEAAHRATPSETPATRDVAAWCATLDAELRGLRELLGEVRQSRDELREQASRLEEQVSRLTPALPAPVEAPRRSWWQRLRAVA